MDFGNVVDDIALVDRCHLAAYLVHEVVALVVAVDGFVELSEALIGVGQRHRAAGLVEEVADFAVMRDADFRVMYNMLKIIVFIEIQNHRAQHLQLDVVLVAFGTKVGLAANDFVDGYSSLVGHLAFVVVEHLEEAVEVLCSKAGHGESQKNYD